MGSGSHQVGDFNGLGMHLGNLSRLSRAETRSISAENFDGAKGTGGMATEGTGAISARELGQGWKVSPSINIGGNEMATLAEIEGPGAIQHIWLTVHPSAWRKLVFRFYWDGEETPSIETPLGDFFCNGWCERTQHRLTAGGGEPGGRIQLLLGDAVPQERPDHGRESGARAGKWLLLPDRLRPDRCAGGPGVSPCPVAAQSNPLPYKSVHTLLDGVEGQGQYVGTYIAWGVNNNGWWGEGEIKFYHGRRRRVADHLRHRHRGLFRRRLEFETADTGSTVVYSTPYLGMPQVIKPDGFTWPTAVRDVPLARSGPDPVQAGLAGDDPGAGLAQAVEGKSRYLPLQDDIASTAIWYQSEPHAPFPALPGADDLEVI